MFLLPSCPEANYCSSGMECLPLLLKRLIDIVYVTTCKTLTGCPAAGHGPFQLPVTGSSLLVGRSSHFGHPFVCMHGLWLYCCSVISPIHRCCCCCRDLQTALVLREAIGGSRFSMLSTSSKRYYTPVSCIDARILCASF